MSDTESRALSRTQGEILLAAVIIARSTSFLCSKFLMQGIDPFNLMAVRFLLAFFLTAMHSQEAASWVYEILIVVSCPMVCSQYWLVSLFLWACLLFATFIPNRK